MNTLKEKLSSVDVNVVAEVGTIQASIKDVLSLRVGDVLRLYDTKVNDPFSLNVGNRQKFLCRPGYLGKKIAVQIVKRTAELTENEYEQLAEEGEDIL
jgi:flagellar motor switch protein FliM